MVDVCSGSSPISPSSRRSSSGKALLLFSSGSSSSRWPLIDIVCDSDLIDSRAGIAKSTFRFLSSRGPLVDVHWHFPTPKQTCQTSKHEQVSNDLSSLSGLILL